MRALLLSLLLIPATSGLLPAAGAKWFKGNTHTHTLNSPDGDTSVLEVADWYRQRDYNFIVITDHNYATDVGLVNGVAGMANKFLVIPGEEVTDQFEKKEIHLTAFGSSKLISPQHGGSVATTIEADRAAIETAGGLAILNHPNYTWAVHSKDIESSPKLLFFELFNGSWSVGNMGALGTPSHEEMWDQVLSTGKRLYGVASDDSHNFHQYFRGIPYPPTLPGLGWIWVRAAELSVPALSAAMEKGDFYASTGVTLDDVAVDEQALTIKIRVFGENRYTTTFVGRNGRILKATADVNPSYTFQKGDTYVRARIMDSTGRMAWTQPVFLSK